jgi:hypothetical protein
MASLFEKLLASISAGLSTAFKQSVVLSVGFYGLTWALLGAWCF